METTHPFPPAPAARPVRAHEAASEETPITDRDALVEAGQPWHAVENAEVHWARAELDDAAVAALLGLYYDADEYDRLIIAYRRARRVALAQHPSAAGRLLRTRAGAV